ncbi:hypothetical protein M406DRAFT_329397 [Cryphonectria parasitica EP155]|uniref:Uncharacterized protein n=1 Tax=Cryphonectria parasitica (strain ATCC 38755 / EP155) TaxID=660469 RepID=A0A9P4Y2R1_CRYP1|nr:uncharacterized protein M406DRAFT_329397 [Cryphonectria parasitica EP155]KAF3765491.1 hypothetical protein M406DRAFT_329397 [Cryphonectria parasitica EP155]
MSGALFNKTPPQAPRAMQEMPVSNDHRASANLNTKFASTHLYTSHAQYAESQYPASLSNAAWPFYDDDEKVHSKSRGGNGSWTNSTTWISEEEKLRVDFARMKEAAGHLGLRKSPYFPRNISEYVEARNHAILRKARLLKESIRGREAAMRPEKRDKRPNFVSIETPAEQETEEMGYGLKETEHF